MTPEYLPFSEFPKMARLSREAIITEKIDGTNASILITELGQFFIGSKSQWITAEKGKDNHGFAAWCVANKEELLKLGPGHHFGEWWGQGIQRNYGLKEKRFSLFNTSRWSDDLIRPACCHVVPVLWRGIFDTKEANNCLISLKLFGSAAVPGFTKPEGVVIWHTAGNFGLKKTIEKDEVPKSFGRC